MGLRKVTQVQNNRNLKRNRTPNIQKYILAVHKDFRRTKPRLSTTLNLSTTENLSTTDTQHTNTTMTNHRTKAIAGLEQLALNNETEEAQPSTKNYTIHRNTMHTHGTFNTREPPNQRRGRTRAPSP